MKPLTAFRRGLAKVRREWRAGNYAGALATVGEMLRQWPDNPQLLVHWADLVQLQDDDSGPTLEDAKTAYARAAELEGPAPAALVDLGHFLYATDDDPAAASKTFEKAIKAYRRLLAEALLARAKALFDLDRRAEALDCLAEAYWIRTREGKRGDGQQADELMRQWKDIALAE